MRDLLTINPEILPMKRVKIDNTAEANRIFTVLMGNCFTLEESLLKPTHPS